MSQLTREPMPLGGNSRDELERRARVLAGTAPRDSVSAWEAVAAIPDRAIRRFVRRFVERDLADRRTSNPTILASRGKTMLTEVARTNLAPSPTKALKSAAADDLKVYKVTREHRVPDGAKAKGERTYGRDHWRRADGGPTPKGRWSSEMVPSKTCEHSAMGVVVAGPGRGQAFLVCVAKKKCEVHWGEWQKERAKAKSRGSESDWKRQQREQEERWKRDQAERKRWQDATPQLLEALAKNVKATKVEDLIGVLVEDAERLWPRNKPELVDRGSTIGDGVRYAAFLVLANTVATSWRVKEGKALLERLGIDGKAIVDEVSPPPAPPAKKPAARKPRKKATAKKKTAASKKAKTRERRTS